jgi:predicted Zn-dependent protease
VQTRAVEAFASQDFQTAVESLSQLVAREPGNLVWLEGRAQALIDGKQFERALKDYNTCAPPSTLLPLDLRPASREVGRRYGGGPPA